MTIDPDHRLASCIDGTVIHNLFSQSYRVTRFTVLEPVGLSASVSSPPRKKMKWWINYSLQCTLKFTYARIPEFCPKVVSSLFVLMLHPSTDPKMFWVGPHFLCQTKNWFMLCATPNLSVPDQKMICINAWSKNWFPYCASPKLFKMISIYIRCFGSGI